VVAALGFALAAVSPDVASDYLTVVGWPGKGGLLKGRFSEPGSPRSGFSQGA
jgi:hypothetical protein